jgi:cytochrome P450
MTSELKPPLFPMDRADPFDPPLEYHALRSEGVRRFTWPNGVEAWLVTRFEDVRDALRDPRLSIVKTMGPPPSLALGRGPGVMLPRSLVGMDPPEHQFWRRPVVRELTVRRLAPLRPRIERIVAEHLDRMERHGPPADLVRSFALPVPSLVISELLGVPAHDQGDFQRYTQVISTVGAPAQDVQAASDALQRYMGELVKSKRRHPGDDILSRMARDFPDDVEPAEDALLGNGMLILVAGHETTANMIALSVLTLLNWPDQLAVMRGDPEAIAPAVEELLRFHAVIQYGLVRRASADLTLAGQQIQAGDWVVCSLASANRDTALCPHPERFQVDRAPEGHVSFGYGIHQCAGQHLARLELSIALPALFDRFPRLRLAEPLDQLSFRDDMFVYGLHKLPLEW